MNDFYVDIPGEIYGQDLPQSVPMRNELVRSLRTYLDDHPDWDAQRVLDGALSLFLLQNGRGDRAASRVYIETLFRRQVSS